MSDTQGLTANLVSNDVDLRNCGSIFPRRPRAGGAVTERLHRPPPLSPTSHFPRLARLRRARRGKCVRPWQMLRLAIQSWLPPTQGRGRRGGRAIGVEAVAVRRGSTDARSVAAGNGHPTNNRSSQRLGMSGVLNLPRTDQHRFPQRRSRPFFRRRRFRPVLQHGLARKRTIPNHILAIGPNATFEIQRAGIRRLVRRRRFETMVEVL